MREDDVGEGGIQVREAQGGGMMGSPERVPRGLAAVDHSLSSLHWFKPACFLGRRHPQGGW